MDFSGTGLADGAWRLEAPEGEKIPASLLKALPSGSEELGSGIRLELGGAGSGGG